LKELGDGFLELGNCFFDAGGLFALLKDLSTFSFLLDLLIPFWLNEVIRDGP
jgi:hypothetical protein